MNKKQIHTLIISLFFSTLCYAQLGDTAKVLTPNAFLWYVNNYHPIAKQGKLQINKAAANLKQQRGNFDPIINLESNNKMYDETNYYRLVGAGLTVPTWFGVELKAGFDQASGKYLNAENTLPSQGLWTAGIKVPIGQGLFIDKRRASLKQALIYQDASRVEQNIILNNLLYSALSQYWSWASTYQQLQVFENAVELAQTRLNAVKQSYYVGAEPAIDTLEAFIQLQNRQLDRNQYKLNYQKSTLELSTYLWFENDIPLEIDSTLQPPNLTKIKTPENISPFDLDTILQNIEQNHPELQLYKLKNKGLQIENRLKAENLKPKLDLSYNFLTERSNEELITPFNPNDYKFGVTFSFPIFLRKERGSLQQTQIKIKENNLSLNQKKLEVENKIKSNFLELNTYQEQIKLYQQSAKSYAQLLAGERSKFEIGESSLFMINSREIKLIEAQIKLALAYEKIYISAIAQQWAAGMLYNYTYK